MVRWMAATATLLAVAVAPIAAAAQTVTVKRGEMTTLVMGDDDVLHVAAEAAVAANPYESKIALEFQRGDYDAAIGANSLPMANDSAAGMLAPTAKPGKLVLRFVRTPGKDASLLSIQNGFDRALAYRATMVIGGKRVATDVCLVPPGKLANEYWPHPIDALDLSQFRLVPWVAGANVVCE